MAVLWRFLLVLLAGLSFSFAGETSAATFGGKRVALVIGNSKYPTAPLKNPVNDARAVAKALKELGFEVTQRENATQRDMAAAVRQFGSAIAPGSVALFYFAGHGMQVKGRNYLVPVDADIQVEDEVPYSTIDVSLMLDKMEVGKSAVNIVILDACRNNPFARRFRSSGTGLAQMDAPIGTLIAFATAPGSVAQDGAGENGIYTKHLLDSIAVPNLPVEQMFKRVRVGVARDTNEAQIPWESSSMKGDFAFREAAPQQTTTQDKLIEEAVRAAAERAAALTAERMAREQAARQPSGPSRAEQDALAAEREKLLRERESLAAENAALRRKAAQAAPVALAAPSPIASEKPAVARTGAHGPMPEAGDRWTYRFADGYGKTETYTVRVTEVTPDGIKDEASVGKARHVQNHEAGLELSNRVMGSLSLREFAPYLQALGPAEPGPEWQAIQIPGGSSPFKARLAGKETVKVPAGSFEASKVIIEGQQFARGMQTRKLTIAAWYVPATRRFVRMTISAPNFMGGMGEEKDVIELVEASLPLAGASATPAGSQLQTAAKVASVAPGIMPQTPNLPHVGDTWTYRFSDMYGKSETYAVRVTAASPSEIADEIRLGKARHGATFASGLTVTHRKLGDLSLREFSPYLTSFGLEETAEWNRVEVFEGKEPFKARLAGNETIRVPAGTFETQKIVIEGRQHSTHLSMTYITRPYAITAWYAPAVKRVVKLTVFAASTGIVPAEQETVELTEYRLQ